MIETDKQENSNLISNDYQQKNYLEFSSYDNFLSALEDENFDAKQMNPNFISMSDIVDQIDSTTNFKEKQELIKEYAKIIIIDEYSNVTLKMDDHNLCKFLTPSGMIKIGKDVVVIDEQYSKIMNENNFDIDVITQTTESNEMVKVTAYETSKVSYTKNHEKGIYKLNIKKFYRNYGTWATIGADLTHYQKDGYDWFKSKTRINATVSWDSFSYTEQWANGPAVEVEAGSGSKSKSSRTKSLHISKTIAVYIGVIIRYFEVEGLKVSSYSTSTGINGSF